MISYIKSIVRKIFYYLVPIQNRGSNNRITISKKYRSGLRVFLYGNNNDIQISDRCIFNGVVIQIFGDNNSLKFDDEVKIQKGKIDLYNGSLLHISHNSTFQEVSINLKEGECRILDDCMFSYGVNIRNHDGHKIINLNNNQIINKPKDIIIDSHVWVGQNTTILKGSVIQQGSIIGCNALVSGSIEKDSIAVGIPAKVIKQNVSWIRH